MISLPDNFENCVCTGNHTPHVACQSKYVLLEKGQALKLEPKNKNESVKLIIIDGCVINDSKTSKCDGLFLHKDKNGVISSFLFELKNTEKWPKPISQLEAVKESDKYNELMSNLSISRRNQKFIVVGSYIPTAIEKRKMEELYGFRVIAIRRENFEPYPNVRDYF